MTLSPETPAIRGPHAEVEIFRVEPDFAEPVRSAGGRHGHPGPLQICPIRVLRSPGEFDPAALPHAVQAQVDLANRNALPCLRAVHPEQTARTHGDLRVLEKEPGKRVRASRELGTFAYPLYVQTAVGMTDQHQRCAVHRDCGGTERGAPDGGRGVDEDVERIEAGKRTLV